MAIYGIIIYHELRIAMSDTTFGISEVKANVPDAFLRWEIQIQIFRAFLEHLPFHPAISNLTVL
jgi:hypothetical protein